MFANFKLKKSWQCFHSILAITSHVLQKKRQPTNYDATEVFLSFYVWYIYTVRNPFLLEGEIPGSSKTLNIRQMPLQRTLGWPHAVHFQVSYQRSKKEKKRFVPYDCSSDYLGSWKHFCFAKAACYLWQLVARQREVLLAAVPLSVYTNISSRESRFIRAVQPDQLARSVGISSIAVDTQLQINFTNL